MKELGRIEKQNLLILDDFGLQVIDNEKQLMLLRLSRTGVEKNRQ